VKDKELIAMWDCPEIQDRWEPKVGDRAVARDFKCEIVVTSIEYYERDTGAQLPDGTWITLPDIKRITAIDSWGNVKEYLSDNLIYIPRIEDVLSWLVPKYWEGWNHAVNAMLDYRFTDDAPPRIWYDHLKSWIAFYMHIEHSKTWEGTWR